MQWTLRSNSTMKRPEKAQVFSPATTPTVLLHRTRWLSCGQVSPEQENLLQLVCQNGLHIPLKSGQACVLIRGARSRTTDSARSLPCGDRSGSYNDAKSPYCIETHAQHWRKQDYPKPHVF